MEETYLLYDDSYGQSFVLDLNNKVSDTLIWSRVVLSWIDSEIFKVTELLSNQSLLRANVAAAEFTPESKNTRNVAVFMVEVSGNSTIWNKSNAEEKIFWDTNSAKEYFHETSYGELEINSDANNDGKYDTFWPFIVDWAWKCEYSTWRSQSVQQAQALWINTSIYDNIILILPSYSKIGCSWAWLWNVWSVDSNYTMYSWIAYPSNSVVQHELGHNFGMWHASTDSDNNWTVNSEYGDQSGVMWWPAGMPLKIWVNAPHMDQLNWGDHIEGFYEFANQSVNNYTLQPLQLDPEVTNWTRVVKFPKNNNNEFYYVSYRQPVWYNSSMYSKYQPGLMIHTYRGSGYSNTKLVKTLSNWEEFYDATNNIRITSMWLDEVTSWMKVLVETNPWTCVKWNLWAVKLFWSDVFKTNIEWKIDFRFTNNDVDCDEQNLTLVNNIDSQLVWNFSSSGVALHPKDFKEPSFIFNTWNQDKQYFYSISAVDNDWVSPDHWSFTFTWSVLVDGTAPTTINNLSYNKVASTYKFTWWASVDNWSGIDKYEVHRNTWSGFVLYRTIYWERGSDIINFNDTDLWTLKYYYKVFVYDNAGNKSLESNIVEIDNTWSSCIFNGWELSLNSRFINTNTWSVHNLPYELTNKNLNCNLTNFTLGVINPEWFNSIIDNQNISLNSGESMTWILQVQTSALPWEYEVNFYNQSLDYTDNNKLILFPNILNFTLNWEYISKPTNLNYIQNSSNFNFTWSGSTYTSVWGDWNSGEKNIVWAAGWNENNVIYELYRSNSDDFNNFNLIYSWSTTSFTDVLTTEKEYKYYVLASNWEWLKSEQSNIVDINYIIPENITGTLNFNSWLLTNNINTQIELNSSIFPVDYVISWDLSQTGSLNSKQNININLSNNDWLKAVNIQYFWNNGKSPLISSSITLDTTKPVFSLLTDISWSGTTAENILLTWTVTDLNWINSLVINWNNIWINNNSWSENINLNIWLNNVNYILIDNAWNTQTSTFVINRIKTPVITDNTPDNFSFTQMNNAQLNTEYNSNIITITWINTWSIISVNNWSYSINNNDFTTLTWVILNNNNLVIKWLSSWKYSTNTTVEVNIGWVIWNYVIKTKSKPSSGWGWGGWSKRKPKVLCTVEEHLVCESSRKWVYKYYKKSWVVCVRWDLGKSCTIDEEKDEEKYEEKDEYSDIKKILLNNKWFLKSNNIDDILTLLKITDYNNIDFEYNTSEDYNDTLVKKIFIINNNKFNTYKEKINNIKYLSEDFKKYLYYLEINNSELNKILLLLDQSRIDNVKTDILKYYREYRVIKDNIKSLNNYLNNIWNIKSKITSNWNDVSYIKYKEKTLRKKQTILFITLKRKEFNTDLFIEINKYLHNQYVLLSNWESWDSDNILYKKLLEKISNL